MTGEEVKSLVFANPQKTMISECLQGTTTRESNDYHHDQTWMCALANVPTLLHRSEYDDQFLFDFLHPKRESPLEVMFVRLSICPGFPAQNNTD